MRGFCCTFPVYTCLDLCPLNTTFGISHCTDTEILGTCWNGCTQVALSAVTKKIAIFTPSSPAFQKKIKNTMAVSDHSYT